MANESEKLTFKDVYEVVVRLENKFDNRLNIVEGKVDDLVTKVAEAEGKAKTLSWVIPLTVSIVVSALGFFIR